MRGEGEEEESCNLKALKTGCFTISVSSSFLYSSGAFSGEKGELAELFIYGEGLERRRKRVAYTILDALEALYRRYRGLFKGNLGRLV